MATTTHVAPRARRRHDAPPRSSIWRETLWGLDWLSLRFSPVYLGLGVPHGDGSPVVLVPGFIITDAYFLDMYFWLRRIGYSPFLSGIGLNFDCIQVLTRWLENTVADVHAETGRPVRLIGHSLGGFLARRVAVRRPDIVSQLISLGAPIQALEGHPIVMAVARFLGKGVERLRHGEIDDRRGSDNCFSERCECLADHRGVPCPPPSVRRAALYSRSDGVIPWPNCLESEPHLNHEVGGTHLGLAFNPRVYRVIASLLAEASAESRRAA